MTDAIRRMVEHLRWADARVLESLRRPGAASPRALEICAHGLAAEHVWVARILGRPSAVAVWPSLTVAECEALARSTHDMLDGIVTTLTDESADRTVHYTNSAGAEFDSKISDILLHLVLHSAYHRGQVTLLVRNAGAEPEPTDYIALARGAAAARTPRP